MSRHNDEYQPGTDDGSRAKSAYAFASATTLLQALNERRISAMELLELYLQRIKRYNPTLNAVVVLNEQQHWRLVSRRWNSGATLLVLFAFQQLFAVSLDTNRVRRLCRVVEIFQVRRFRMPQWPWPPRV